MNLMTSWICTGKLLAFKIRTWIKSVEKLNGHIQCWMEMIRSFNWLRCSVFSHWIHYIYVEIEPFHQKYATNRWESARDWSRCVWERWIKVCGLKEYQNDDIFLNCLDSIQYTLINTFQHMKSENCPDENGAIFSKEYLNLTKGLNVRWRKLNLNESKWHFLLVKNRYGISTGFFGAL